MPVESKILLEINISPPIPDADSTTPTIEKAPVIDSAEAIVWLSGTDIFIALPTASAAFFMPIARRAAWLITTVLLSVSCNKRPFNNFDWWID